MITSTAIKIDPNNVTTTYWRYAVPTLLAMLVNGLYQVVDGIFIGHIIGAEGLAAINIAWPWAGLIAGVGVMIGNGTGVRSSMAQGEGDLLKAGRIVAQGVWLLLLLGVAVGAFIIMGSDSFLHLQGASGTLHTHASDYMNIMGWAAPLVMASVTTPVLVRNLGAPRLATLMMIMGAITNIFLDYLFIMRFGWGLRGAALATVIGGTLSGTIGLLFLLTRYSSVPLRPLNRVLFSWHPRLSFAILSNGLSSLLMYLHASFAVVLHNIALMHYGGTLHVAAYAIAGYLMTAYYLFAEGLAGGMQPIVSYFHGADLPKPIRQVFRLALKYIVGGGIILVALMLLFPYPFTWIFIDEDDPALQVTAINTIRLHLFVLFLEGFLVLSAVYFQAIGQSKKATAITLGNMCIQIPFLLLLAPWLSVTGILLTLPLSTIVLSLAVAWIIKSQFTHLKEQHLWRLR